MGYQVNLNPVKPPGHRLLKYRFIENNLDDISQLIEKSVFAENLSRENGLLQSIDPRIKIIALLAFLISVGLSHNLWVILAFYGLAFVLAWASKLPMGLFTSRVWLFMPFFTGIVALPALFITPGPILWQLPLNLIVTRTGALTALFLLLRVGTSVSLVILIVLTTSWNSLLKALKILYVPDVIVLILGMTYRYIYLLLMKASDMFLSRKSRIVGRLSGRDERELVAETAGALLSRSLQISDEVYLAMQSRGFYRVPKTMDAFYMRWFDWLVGIAVIMIAILAIYAGR